MNAGEANLDSFSQHFDQPINRDEMEALQVLVEHETKLEKQAGSNKGAVRRMGMA